MNIFDRKTFLRKCTGCKEKLAIRASFCDDNSIPWWWCNECEPDLIGTLKEESTSPLPNRVFIKFL